MTKKPKGQARQAASSALWGMLGAWAWERFGKRTLDRIPFWWKVIGGLLLAGILALLFRMPELAGPVFIATLGLIVYRIVGGNHKRLMSPDKIVRDWPNIVAENQTLSAVLKGSTARKVAQDKTGYTIALSLANGRTPAEVDRLRPNLASVFNVEDESQLRIVRQSARTALLRFVLKDPLEQPVPWRGTDAESIQEPIALGEDEHGLPVRVRLLGQHVLVAGVTGSGKSTVCEDLIRGLIAMDDVEIWGVDCKPGGVELGPWRDHMARFATEAQEVVDLLTEAREELTTRGRMMSRSHLKQWPVSPEKRAIVLMIDELAEMPAEAKVTLDKIVRLARAMAIIVVAATQRPSVQTFGELGGSLRSQLTCTIGLRVGRPEESRIIFGEDAQAKGWRLDQLTVKGTFLLRDDDHQEPVRARAYWPGNHPIPQPLRLLPAARQVSA